MLSMAASHGRNGVLTDAQVSMLGDAEPMQRLLDAGLVERLDFAWRIHDYLDYNPSDEKRKHLLETRRKAARSGGLKTQASARSKTQASSLNSRPVPSRPVPSLSCESERAPELPLANQPEPLPDWARIQASTFPELSHVLEEAWARFCAYGKPRDAVQWGLWLTGQLTRLRLERERRREAEAQAGARIRASAEARADVGYVPPPPLITSKQEREYQLARARRDATLPQELAAPVEGLLAALEGKRACK